MQMTQEYVRELFAYKDGMLFWKVKPAKQIAIGTRAGTLTKINYRIISIKGEFFLEHRLIWIMFNGEIPDGMRIDHKDGAPFHNHIDNLRLATTTQNIWNSRISKNNKSGYKGVSFCKDKNKWIAQIGANGIKKHLGYFSTPQLANEAYKIKAKELHGDFANQTSNL